MIEAVKVAYKALDEKFGKDIVVLDISNISVMADYFLIATGNSTSQVKAMADEAAQQLHKIGIHSKQSEGYNSAEWILLDFGDIIVHVFNKESRQFYNLERVWGDATVITF